MGLLGYLKECLEVTKSIKLNLGELMATAQEFKDVLKEISGDIDRLSELIRSGSLTGEEEAEVLEGLKSLRDRVAAVKAPVTPEVVPPVDPAIDPATGRRR